MTAQIIDGKDVAKKTRQEIKACVDRMQAKHGVTPHLAVVLASDDPASAVYVRNKGKAADSTGIRSTQHTLDASTSREDLLALIHKLNDDPDIDGILVQLPLPKHHNEDEIIKTILPEKDVDGLHPVNAGYLSRGQENTLISCTPMGSIRLIEETGTSIEGKNAVVVGRSRLVGRPVADLLLNRNATVTICHSRTKDLPSVVKQADILIVAVGKENFVKGDWIKPGAVVIDVGINRNAEGKLVGDVEFSAASEHAGYITPVPGGVGPMTITYLMDNTVRAALRRRFDEDITEI